MFLSQQSLISTSEIVNNLPINHFFNYLSSNFSFSRLRIESYFGFDTGKEETNNEGSKQIISETASKARLYKKELMKHTERSILQVARRMGINSELSNLLPSVLRKRVFLKHKQNKKNENEKRKKNPKQKSRIQLNVKPTMSNHYFSFAKVLIFIFL